MMMGWFVQPSRERCRLGSEAAVIAGDELAGQIEAEKSASNSVSRISIESCFTRLPAAKSFEKLGAEVRLLRNMCVTVAA